MYKETYNNCKFNINEKGTLIFEQLPPDRGYWGRYFKMSELKELDAPNTDIKRKVEIAHTAIDRAEHKTVVFNGDLRYRHLEDKS